ncbi:integrase core domain-containing protein, partial [Pseudovibrio sp. POLY-S9]|uniref:integrase core domain-containing protein n=1 Tax=Pseudovibrio sp. POLY-S9 TaxID=1576596 RepID=UPI000ABF9E36
TKRLVRRLNKGLGKWQRNVFNQTVRKQGRTSNISEILLSWAQKQGIHIRHIQPGKPAQNAYVERYNRTVRQEWLDQSCFESIEQAQWEATNWLWTYNNQRPNMAIGGITPADKIKQAA